MSQQINRSSPDTKSVPYTQPITISPPQTTSANAKSKALELESAAEPTKSSTSPTYYHIIRYPPTSKLLNTCLSRSQASNQNTWHSPLSKLLNACLHRAQVSINKVRTIPLPSCNSNTPYNSRCTPLSQSTSTYCALLPQIINPESWAMPTSGICALSPPLLSVQHRPPKPQSYHKACP